jgi:hypothetical protein
VSGGAKGKTALGCTNRCGDSTRTSSSHARTRQGHPEAATITRGGARRTAAVAALRRRRAGGVEHEHPNQRHWWAPYITAIPLSSTKATERRRAGGTRATTLDELGLGDAAVGARVGGETGERTRRGGGLNRRRMGRWLAGPRLRNARRPDPGSSPSRRRGGDARKLLTSGPRASATGGDGALAGLAGLRLARLAWVGKTAGAAALGRENAGGLRCWAGTGGFRGGCLLFFLILFSFKTIKQFEFKSRFESKHPKTMHRHECNSKLLYFIN